MVITAGAEAEAGFHTPGVDDGSVIGNPVNATAGVEGRMSLNTGAASINGTGIFGK